MFVCIHLQTGRLDTASGGPDMELRMPSKMTRSKAASVARVFFLVLCCAICSAPSSSRAEDPDWFEDLGYTRLRSFLGESIPTGAGVPISLVEASGVNNNNFFPSTSDSEFGTTSDPTEPIGVAVSFTNGSTSVGSGTSTHATTQARNFFGNTLSFAPEANAVTVYEADNYLNNILNLTGSNSDAPDTQAFKVQNFSWVGNLNSDSNDREALRRFDYSIEADNISAFVGLDNNTAALPRLLSQSYNSIAVGRSDGIHSTGLTNLTNYGTGRSKPDLVAPRSSSSNATSTVSSVATFLHSSPTVIGTSATNSEAIKAILLAGATKDEFSEWSQIDSSGQWRPLDDTYGAGEVNLYNSYLATLGGQFAGGTTSATPVASHGWDYQTVQPGAGNELLYDFEIPVGSVANELSIALTWNAIIAAPFHTGDPVVADLNLELVDSNGITVDLDVNEYVEGLSQSDVDNVEHLYLTDLAAGTYTLKVSSDDLSSDFGLAWRTSTAFDTISADFDEDGDVDGSDFFAWQRGYGTLVNATRADGDADGDGDVDSDDLDAYRNAIADVSPSFSRAIFAVPEPASWLLLCGSCLLFFSLRGYPISER